MFVENDLPKELPRWPTHVVDDLRPFAAIELIVVDLDGTLLGATSPGLAPAVQKLKASLRNSRHRVRLSVATGRALSGAKGLLQQLSLDRGMPVVLYNGGQVILPNDRRVLFKRLISSESAVEVLKIGMAHQVNVLFYVCEATDPMQPDIVKEIVYGWGDDHSFGVEFNGLTVAWQVDMEIAKKLQPVAVLFDVRGSPSQLENIRNEVSSIRGVSATTSGTGFLEFRAAGCDKGVALADLAKFLKLKSSQVLAIGDNDNDAEMLKSAGIGVCVEGASERALRSCDFKCRFGVVGGVIEVLHIVRQAKRYFGVSASIKS